MVQHDLQERIRATGDRELFMCAMNRKMKSYMKAPEVEMVAGLIEELIEYLNDDDDCPHALVKGAMAHLNLVMIHPFSDGNGRMARCFRRWF